MGPPQRQQRAEVQCGFDQQDLGGLDLVTPELVVQVANLKSILATDGANGRKFYPRHCSAAKQD
jgi:hypothetical protein